MKYKIKKGFIAEIINHKTTIFDGEESTLYTFNEVGSYIFTKIKQGMESEKIIDKLSLEYNIDRQRAKKDFAEFINVLTKNKIVSSLKQKKPGK